KKGNTALAACPKLIFPILIKTNKTTPKGGVNIAISLVITITTPRWMVSIPTVSAKGTKIGVTAAIVASSSINIPRIIKNPTIINKIIFGSLLTETLHSASLWGTCCIINTLANNCVTATTIKTIPDVSTENTKDSHNTLMFLSFLVTNKPTNKAYRTATTEASTGVNIP